MLFQLIRSKCLPVLYYGTDVCPVTSAIKHSLDFVMSRIIYKIFGVMSKEESAEVCRYFGLWSASEIVHSRQSKFMTSYSSSDNVLCQLLIRI